MPDSPAAPAPPRVPPEPLRRIDWLAVAPWVLLFRVPGVCLGWPLFWGGIGAIVVGWPNIDATVQTLEADHVAESSIEMLSGVWGVTPWHLAVWPLVGVLIVAHAAGRIGRGRSERWQRVLAMWPKRTLRVATATAMLLVPTASLVVLLRLYLLGIGLPGVGMAFQLAYPLAFWLFALPSAAALAVVVVGLPLAIASICVDDADAFDAASRTVAYVTQRVLRFMWYLMVAAAVGLPVAAVTEALLSAAYAIQMQLGFFEALRGVPKNPFELAMQIATRGVRGVYPAYFFTAATAIYLLLRQDIDGQPLDEMAGASDQPAA